MPNPQLDPANTQSVSPLNSPVSLTDSDILEVVTGPSLPRLHMAALVDQVSGTIKDLCESTLVPTTRIAQLAGIGSDDPRTMTAGTSADITRHGMSLWCSKHAIQHIKNLYETGSATDRHELINYVVELKNELRNAARYDSLQTGVEALSQRYSESGGGKSVIPIPGCCILRNGELTGIVTWSSSSYYARPFPVVDGKIVEIQGVPIHEIKQYTLRDGLIQGRVTLEANAHFLPMFDNQVITMIDDRRIQHVPYCEPSTGGFTGIVQFEQFENINKSSTFTGSTFPVTDGNLITEIDGMKILHTSELKVKDGMINGRFWLSDDGAIKFREVVDSELKNPNSWTFNERTVDPVSQFDYIQTGEYHRLSTLPVQSRLEEADQLISHLGYRENRGWEEALTGLQMGSMVTGLIGGPFCAVPLIKALGVLPTGNPSADIMICFFGYLTSQVGGAMSGRLVAALIEQVKHTAPQPEFRADRMKLLIFSLMGHDEADEALQKIIINSSDPEIIKAALHARYPQYAQYTVSEVSGLLRNIPVGQDTRELHWPLLEKKDDPGFEIDPDILDCMSPAVRQKASFALGLNVDDDARL